MYNWKPTQMREKRLRISKNEKDFEFRTATGPICKQSPMIPLWGWPDDLQLMSLGCASSAYSIISSRGDTYRQNQRTVPHDFPTLFCHKHNSTLFPYVSPKWLLKIVYSQRYSIAILKRKKIELWLLFIKWLWLS